MAGLAAYFTVSAFMALFLWLMDTFLLWVIGYIGFGIYLPLAVAAWIAYAVSKIWAAKGKPKPNVFAIYSGVTGSFLMSAVVFGIIAYNARNSGESWGYGFMTLFLIVPTLFMECLVTTICAVARKKQPPVQSYGAYVNPQFNAPYGNMQGGMPYGNAPYNYPNNYQGGYPNGNYPPNYPNGNYPPNYPNGNYPNNNFQNNDYRQ